MGFFSTLFGKKDNSELINALHSGAYLIDVRSPTEFASGSVKGAVNVPLDTLSRQTEKLKSKKQIVVFCMSGGRSSQAKTILEQGGCPNVINGGSWSNVSNLQKG